MERRRLERVREIARTVASEVEHERLLRRPWPQETDRRAAAYDAAREIAGALAGEADLEAVLGCVAERARAHAGARTAVLALVEGDDVVVGAAAGRADRALVGERAPRTGSLLGRVARLRRPLRVADLGERALFEIRLGERAALLVPMTLRGSVAGVLAAFDRLDDAPAFDVEDERRLEAFALGAAAIVAAARAVAADGVRRALQAAERERRRWARELHDETLQELGALRVLLGDARRSRDAARLEDAVDAGLTRLSEQADALRALIAELHPSILRRFGVRAAVEALLARIHARDGLEVGLDLRLGGAADAGGRLAPEVELTIYRTVQEALTNVVRHAAASRAEVEIRERAGDVVVRVSDDGRGFSTRAGTDGMGIAGMRERVRLLAGDLVVRSRPGRGTTVCAVIPAGAAAHAADDAQG